MINSKELKTIDYLNSLDDKFYIDMTDPLTLGNAKSVVLTDKSALTLNNGVWMWTAEDFDKAIEIIEFLKKNRKDEEIVAHCNIAVDECYKMLGCKWMQVPCYVAARFSKELYSIDTDAEIKPLSEKYADFVSKTYTFYKNNPNGRAYAEESIQRGMYGAFKDGKLIGFIGTHHEGTMGMLEVLPEYRKHGYGIALEKYLANDFIKQGKYPFCHILETNTASLALQRKMGLWLSDNKRVYWMS